MTPSEYFRSVPAHLREAERTRLANLAAVSVPTMRHWEAGSRVPTDPAVIATLVTATAGTVQAWEWWPELGVLFTPTMRSVAPTRLLQPTAAEADG
jgi:hypothetical protein